MLKGGEDIIIWKCIYDHDELHMIYCNTKIKHLNINYKRYI